ncbi:DNA-3-methyladenine glycosylase [Brevundimonas lutea]|uniref:DNA-3-methyladenine glycosylase n=1 Tax=Brevundimonas lutea TaxID=2293980 RepID=UPI001F0C7F11
MDGVGGVIVETEAYDVDDPASHSFGGPRARNLPMFGPAGRAYVYRIYGLHWCLNVVCDAARPGSAVLIRALEPTLGLDRMRERRPAVPDRHLARGPGRLCQALGVTGVFNGADACASPFSWSPPATPASVVTGTRIGIRRGAETPWRFGLRGSPWLSRPFP